MQKVWKQIGFDMQDLAFLSRFIEDNHCKNESVAIKELINAHQRFRVVINNLERAAWNQTNIDRQQEAPKKIKAPIKGIEEAM